MDISTFIAEAIAEDIGHGDHTSLATIPFGAKGSARLLVKENGIIAGVELAQRIFKTIDPELLIDVMINDGHLVERGQVIFTVSGKVHSILKSERLVLNCMQRMSGIATNTRLFVNLLEGTGTRLLDTRKTTPNMRLLEKWAVKIGGGENHRMGLYDMIMIKDNHIDFAGGIPEAIHAARQYLTKNQLNLKIEIEVRNLEELKTVIMVGGVHRIMLDNFGFDDLRTAVKMIDKRYETEASGGITEESIREYASCGVDFISVGALTHHIKSLDLSLKAC